MSPNKRKKKSHPSKSAMEVSKRPILFVQVFCNVIEYNLSFLSQVANISVFCYLASGANVVFVRSEAISKPYLAKCKVLLSHMVCCSGYSCFHQGCTVASSWTLVLIYLFMLQTNLQDVLKENETLLCSQGLLRWLCAVALGSSFINISG